VEQGGTVTVWGNVIYNTGEPVVNADVNISILNEDVYWVANTNANGDYFQDIVAPSDSGSYWIKASVTKSGFSDSQQERLTVQVPPSQPDLEISSSNIIFSKNDPYSGETIQITVGVNNIGNDGAQGVVVNAYYGDPATQGKPISPDSTKTISQIPEGQTEYVTFNWDTSGITGSQDVYIVLDPGNSVSESNENNNKDFNTITILGRADFKIDQDDITFSTENPTVDDTITIFITLHNLGSESGRVEYEVFDGDPDDDGLSIDSGEESLSDGDETQIFVTWTPNEAGEHVIFVVLTAKTGVEESDESNNKAYNTLTVEKKPGEDGPPSNLLPLIIILVVVVLLILFILYRRGQGEKPQQDIPSATVVQKESVAKVIEPKEKKEEESMMEGQGGMRI
jgi:subtilase family serine protease